MVNTTAAPVVFLVGLVVAVSMLASVLQGVPVPLNPDEPSEAAFAFLAGLNATSGITLVLIVVLVQVIQLVGERISRSLDHR